MPIHSTENLEKAISPSENLQKPVAQVTGKIPRVSNSLAKALYSSCENIKVCIDPEDFHKLHLASGQGFMTQCQTEKPAEGLRQQLRIWEGLRTH